MADVDDDFDALFSEIMGEAQKAPVVDEVPEEPAVVKSLQEVPQDPPVDHEAVTQTIINAGPVRKPPPKADVEKVPMNADSAPFKTLLYPKLGYISNVIPGWRFTNKFVLYHSDLVAMRDFFKSDECEAWLADLQSAGFRDRGTPRKEG